MTLFHEIEAECERLADCPDMAENAKLGITFRTVWWRQIRQELSNQATEIERLKGDLQVATEWADSLLVLFEDHSCAQPIGANVNGQAEFKGRGRTSTGVEASDE